MMLLDAGRALAPQAGASQAESTARGRIKHESNSANGVETPILSTSFTRLLVVNDVQNSEQKSCV